MHGFDASISEDLTLLLIRYENGARSMLFLKYCFSIENLGHLAPSTLFLVLFTLFGLRIDMSILINQGKQQHQPHLLLPQV